MFSQVINTLKSNTDSIFLTQHQIKLFCKEYSSIIKKEDAIFIFLFKVVTVSYVVYVNPTNKGELYITLSRLSEVRGNVLYPYYGPFIFIIPLV